MKKLVIILFLVGGTQAFSQQPEFRFHGLKIYVDNLDKAAKFYGDFLGFDVNDKKQTLVVPGQSFPIYIRKSQEKSETNYPLEARTSLALQVDKLLPAVDRLRANELIVYDTLLERNGVGIAIPFQDYSGNVMSFIEVQVYDPGPIGKIRLYNCGVTISDMAKAYRFYIDILGFKEWSRNYLPSALPLKHEDGSFAFMIHAKKNLQPNQHNHATAPQMNLILSTSDIQVAKSYLKDYGVTILNMAEKDKLICRDVEGNIIEIVQSTK